MRRLHLVLAIIVVTSLVSAFLAERSRPRERPETSFESVPELRLAPLEARRGNETLRGIVVDREGRPFEAATIHLRMLSSDEAVVEPLFFDQSHADGRFEIAHLPRGTFQLTLLASGYPHTTMTLSVPYEGGELRLSLPEPWGELRAAPPLVRTSLEGFLVAPAGLGGPSLEGYEVLLVPNGDDALWRGAVERREVTNASGRFRVEELAVASYKLHVVPPWARGGSWPFLAAVDLGAESLVEAGATGEGDPLRVELAVGEIEGVLADDAGRSVEGALIRLHPVNRASQLWPAASSDAEGRFRVRDLPAGVVYVVEVVAGAERESVEVLVEAGLRARARFRGFEPAAGGGGGGGASAGAAGEAQGQGQAQGQ